MTAIILCPGPSLSRYTPQPADVVITVNRAVLAFPCNWWACLDYPVIRDIGPNITPSRPSLFSRMQTVVDIARRPQRLARFPEVRLIEDLPVSIKSPTTACAALLFAAHLGATSVDVYGADWHGTEDFDGAKAGEDRAEDRWVRERESWGLACGLSPGVVVRRVGVDE